ncbi:MAG: urea carboxylase-associated family protein [Deinococcota bacterium]|nr:urea carboxylase-associated family protein [Deinococcota bacterium]
MTELSAARQPDSQRILPQSGVAFSLKAGETLVVIDPMGEQVADLIAFAADDPSEWLSSGRTFDYNETIYLTTGHTLYSNRSRPMLTLLHDDVKQHDFLLTPCAPETFELLYPPGTAKGHPSCLGNLTSALEPYGVAQDQIPTTLNIFMNVRVAGDGRVVIGPPVSKAGDRLELRAECDLVVGLTACSAEMSNNGAFKPIDYRVLPVMG